MTSSEGSVAGLVLAAGKSERMGAPKALLELDGRTFLDATVRALRDGGCDPVAVAVGSPDAAFAARSAGARVVPGDPSGEQIDSLQAGLAELEDDPVDAVAVLPVDHPRVRAATVAALLAAWREETAGEEGSPTVVRPTHEGRPGHPTLFPRPLWAALRRSDLERGARSVVEAARVLDVAVDDPGVLLDIDTPEELDRHGGGP